MDCFCIVTFDRKSDLEIECIRGSGLELVRVADSAGAHSLVTINWAVMIVNGRTLEESVRQRRSSLASFETKE